MMFQFYDLFTLFSLEIIVILALLVKKLVVTHVLLLTALFFLSIIPFLLCQKSVVPHDLLLTAVFILFIIPFHFSLCFCFNCVSNHKLTARF
jgi:hypothetical protein